MWQVQRSTSFARECILMVLVLSYSNGPAIFKDQLPRTIYQIRLEHFMMNSERHEVFADNWLKYHVHVQCDDGSRARTKCRSR
jgi:hypothetical protein